MYRNHWFRLVVLSLSTLGFGGFTFFKSLTALQAEDFVKVESFSPQGYIKKVRQIQVRFSEDMVPLGDLRVPKSPFIVSCSEKGSPRWADTKNWIYDFDTDLPPGAKCELRANSDFKSISGRGLSNATPYSFFTGGPAVTRTWPYQGSSSVSEDQIFILELDGSVNEQSAEKLASLKIESLAQPVPFRLVTGDKAKQLIKASSSEHYWESDSDKSQKKKFKIVLEPTRRIPNEKKLELVWAKGILSKNGGATQQDQILNFRSRGPFRASFSCTREEAAAPCNPVGKMTLNFSEQVSKTWFDKIKLTAKDGTTVEPKKPIYAEGNDYFSWLEFDAPFSAKSVYSLKLPAELQDDSGRPLENSRSFPLTITTADYSPLIKFPADFGIIELNADANLPVTLRYVEAPALGTLKSWDASAGMVRLGASKMNEVWNVMANLESKFGGYNYESREISYLEQLSQPSQSFSIPRPQGKKAFEVLGIPLKKPGFYVVEIKSPILGASLLPNKATMYVKTAALVTNLGVHFKRGRESSLVWVTRLDNGEPVPEASVQVINAKGESLVSGKTDKSGVFWINKDLGESKYIQNKSGFFVAAEKGDDFSFVLSKWDHGIESWRYNLSMAYNDQSRLGHSVLDRTLFRAGEKVHMKHFLREHVMEGFKYVSKEKWPRFITVRHMGSNEEVQFPAKWKEDGTCETQWAIPPAAKLGTYSIIFSNRTSKKVGSGNSDSGDFTCDYLCERENIYSGNFQVEEFRIPTMRAEIHGPQKALVLNKEVTVNFSAQYLSGGPASDLPVKIHYLVSEGSGRGFADFPSLSFSRGKIPPPNKRNRNHSDQEVLKPTSAEVKLDRGGTGSYTIKDLKPSDKSLHITSEMEFADANGEIQAVSTNFQMWPSRYFVALENPNSSGSKSFKLTALVVDDKGKPVAGVPVTIESFEMKNYSHRKRLVGGFYSYENREELKSIGNFCSGKTESNGRLFCEKPWQTKGQIYFQATASDPEKHLTSTFESNWFYGDDYYWSNSEDSDRIDLIPEKKNYQPGEVAKVQVRMPFKEATVLVTTEREGVHSVMAKKIYRDNPVIEVPILPYHSPNVYISAFLVRGRTGDVQPTALVDLGKPAFKIGITDINVGWKNHELQVAVKPKQSRFRIREKAKVQITVKNAHGEVPPKGTEVIVAAVDEGLLELKPNGSWDLLAKMMGHRPYEVHSSTAQMQIIGKRHFGQKAKLPGGGGGSSAARELFDTLLLWKTNVSVNSKGEAEVEIPLNDSLSSFKIVAVAHSGSSLFGMGAASIETFKEIILYSGIAPLVREGDQIDSTFTVRNTTDKALELTISGAADGLRESLAPKTLKLAGGKAEKISWRVKIPLGVQLLTYEITAQGPDKLKDQLKVTQKVVEAVPVRTVQATIEQLDKPTTVPVSRTADAVVGRGGVSVKLQSTLSAGLEGVREFMGKYPYSCLEQKVSTSIATGNLSRWEAMNAELATYLDGDGLTKYWPQMIDGSDSLTSFILLIAAEKGWALEGNSKERMLRGLESFVSGKIQRNYSYYPRNELNLRKLAALAALARNGRPLKELLSAVDKTPNLWSTSGVLDWLTILRNSTEIEKREDKIAEAEQILRSRLNFQGTTMGFSTESSDRIWWMMTTVDLNSARLLFDAAGSATWANDIPRLVRGLTGRQKHGHWDLTTANAWAVLALEKFSTNFEKEKVSGTSTAKFAGTDKTWNWPQPIGYLKFDFPTSGSGDLNVKHEGAGKPWVTYQVTAAIPLKAPLSSGYKIKKTLSAVQQKTPGSWSEGDIVRVRLDIDAQTDMSWVAITDPVPAGSTILGSGLGRDSALAVRSEKSDFRAWPIFVERSFENYRSYYEFIKKGLFSLEYTYRLNQAGQLILPVTRVEAMYSPELFGEIPNDAITIR